MQGQIVTRKSTHRIPATKPLATNQAWHQSTWDLVQRIFRKRVMFRGSSGEGRQILLPNEIPNLEIDFFHNKAKNSSRNPITQAHIGSNSKPSVHPLDGCPELLFGLSRYKKTRLEASTHDQSCKLVQGTAVWYSLVGANMLK
ncbi:hypothetical protein ONS95_013665 [Cadophora gregata]|uniref:uncharacterized protein n=1 Tax=Cadophora gregata TaxID=51156 RepID=UPI0026DAD590|nr:uncharacterized protein ONS95_013665 [Cadophora gregata]KAK0114164.1 hypothetical protein ONS95_013665 [Cadophora gregata]